MEVREIGYVESCYAEKFGTPRQSGVAGSAWGKIVFAEEYQHADYIRGLEGFSYLWLVFVFHESAKQAIHAQSGLVRPPRLGGNEKVGVFASRSPFRPNPIGLSLVRIEKIEQMRVGGAVIHISGVDVVSGTPLLDIKPYIPYCDSVDGEVETGYVRGAPEMMDVTWDSDVGGNLEAEHRMLIEETLAVDPRPAYHDDEREYGCLISGVNVRWKVVSGLVEILSCARV